jgi:transposase InsO family protein
MIRQAHQEHPELSLRRLCALFGLSRSWYYACPEPAERATRDRAPRGTARHAGPRATRDRALRGAMEALVLEFPGYGYRRVTHALRRAGWEQVNHKRVLRVMREESLLCQLKRRFVVTTDSAHAYRTYPNLLATTTLDHLDQAWVADITYVRLPTAFVYLACLLDASSRRCIGWKLSRQIDTRLTLAALEMAVAQRQPAPGLIHHADRGVQYASTEYVARLEQIGAHLSMSAVGDPYDNAKAASFFKALKHEEVYLNDYQTFAEAEAPIGRFIEAVYNVKRLHSSLGYRPPAEFEAAYSTPQMAEVTLPLVR